MLNLPSKLWADVRSRIKASPCYSNRASSLGAACTRQLVYARTNWANATLPDVDAKRVYELGERVERDVIRMLIDAGYTVIEQQRPLDDFADVQITGHVDGVIIEDGKAIPFDVKSMAPHIWDSIAFAGPDVYEWNAVAPAFERRPWLKKYRAQIQLYALCKNAEYGVLICFNKSTGEIAQVNCPLDIDYCDTLLERAKVINKCVADGTLPERIPWDVDECGKCSFLHLCLPDRVGKDPIAFIDDTRIAQACLNRLRLQQWRDEWEEADKLVKEWAKAQEWERALVVTDPADHSVFDVFFGSQSFEILKKANARGTTVSIRLVAGEERRTATDDATRNASSN